MQDRGFIPNVLFSIGVDLVVGLLPHLPVFVECHIESQCTAQSECENGENRNGVHLHSQVRRDRRRKCPFLSSETAKRVSCLSLAYLRLSSNGIECDSTGLFHQVLYCRLSYFACVLLPLSLTAKRLVTIIRMPGHRASTILLVIIYFGLRLESARKCDWPSQQITKNADSMPTLASRYRSNEETCLFALKRQKRDEEREKTKKSLESFHRSKHGDSLSLKIQAHSRIRRHWSWFST